MNRLSATAIQEITTIFEAPVSVNQLLAWRQNEDSAKKGFVVVFPNTVIILSPRLVYFHGSIASQFNRWIRNTPSSILFFSLPFSPIFCIFTPRLSQLHFYYRAHSRPIPRIYIYIRYAWFRIQRVARAWVTYAGKQRQVRGLIRRFLTRMNTYNEARNCCVRTWRYRFNKGFRSCARFCITLLSKWPE